MKLVDIGCSTGAGMNIFNHLGLKPENLYGIDVNEAAIKVAGRVNPQYKIRADYEAWFT